MEKSEAKELLFSYALLKLKKTPGTKTQFECPYCHNKRSFAIDTIYNHFSCFNGACKLHTKGGDIFDLISIIEGIETFPEKLDFLDSIKDNLSKLNKEGTKKNFDPLPTPKQEQPKKEILKETIAFNKKNHLKLLESESALNQLKFRGFSMESIERFNFGFIPPSKTEENKLIPGSITIPFPESNHFICWNYNHKRNKMNKYIELGSKEIYNQIIIGKTSRPIFVCEGIFDTLTILQAGFEAVCLCSTQEINSFVEFVKENRPAGHLIIIFDNDFDKPENIGLKSAEDLKKRLQEIQIPSIINISLIERISKQLNHNFKDINEIISYSKKAIPLLKRYLQNAEEFASINYSDDLRKLSYKKQ